MNINLQGLCYLAAWQRGLDFEAGMAHEALLRSFRLDYSWASLERIDAFLDQIRNAEQPSEATFLDNPHNQNLLYFLAFYIGEVRARSTGTKPQWASWDELLAMNPGMRTLGEGFHSSLAQISPGLFLPLVAISARLFEGDQGKSVAFSAGMELDIPPALSGLPANAPLPPIPGQSLMPSYSEKFATLPQTRRDAYLGTEYPEWPPAIVDRMRSAIPALLREGRMVWAANVLAHGSLYDGSADAAPAEIVYDPSGMVDPEVLNGAAAMLLSLRGKEHASPELQKYATHLTEAAEPLLDWQTPPELMPYPLSTCTLMINAHCLPGRRIVMKNFPVLVSDRHPGVAFVAPQEVWPAALLKEWLPALPPEVAREAVARLTGNLPSPASAPRHAEPAGDPVDQMRAAAAARNVDANPGLRRMVKVLMFVCAATPLLWSMWSAGLFS